MSSTITVADMKDQLLSLDNVRNTLAQTEPLASIEVPNGIDHVGFNLHGLAELEQIKHLAGTDRVDAYVTIDGVESQLTKDALLTATSKVGLTEAYVLRNPGRLIEPHLNYWFQRGLGGPNKDLNLLKVGDTAAAFTKRSINPFSNIRFLDIALDRIEAKYGKGEVFVDYKFQHDLNQTALRLIVPEYRREITDTGRDGDNWSVGIQIKNSLTGLTQTEIDAYLFAWWCTNGAITTNKEEREVWSRRGKDGNVTETDLPDTVTVYDWAAEAVDSVLGGLEHSLDEVQGLTSQPVTGDANAIFQDLFTEWSIPAREQLLVLENYAEDPGPETMYRVMSAITAAANNTDMEASHIERLLRAGGQLPTLHHERCDKGTLHRV